MTVKTSARIVLSERVSMSAARAVVVDPRARKSKIQVTRFLSFEVAEQSTEALGTFDGVWTRGFSFAVRSAATLVHRPCPQRGGERVKGAEREMT
jgi:hypothetical protein